MQTFLLDIIREAGKLAKEYFDAGVTHRTKENLGDLLTDADIAVSNFLVSQIHRRYPDHHIHSEELADDINPGAEYEWVIDPIDGTRNFAMGISFWCQLVAVMKNGAPYLAAIYNPNADELFFAEVGRGAVMNGKAIHVNSTSTLDYGFGVCVRAWRDNPGGYVRMMERLIHNTTVWMHNYGTMLACCYVANGGIDFFVGNSGFDHDNLAPTLICKEAGAVVTDSEGKPWQRGRSDLVIANPHLHPRVLELLRV